MPLLHAMLEYIASAHSCVVQKKHAQRVTLSLLDNLTQAEGNLAGPEGMYPSSLDIFKQVAEYTEHPQMQQLFDLAAWMLQPLPDNRPTGKEVIVKLQDMRVCL